MKILLLVHVEDSFRSRFDKDLITNIKRKSKRCDATIHFTSEVDDYNPIIELHNYIDKEISWGWGYEPACFDYDENEVKYVIESCGHEYTWIPPYLRDVNWKNDTVLLGGGCDGECLADMESVLSHLEIDYKRCNDLIYS